MFFVNFLERERKKSWFKKRTEWKKKKKKNVKRMIRRTSLKISNVVTNSLRVVDI